MEKKTIQQNRPKLPPLEDYMALLEQIWQNNWLTNVGPIHLQFEQELRNHLRVPCLELFANGHLALEIALKTLQLQGEVITTPFTFASTTHAILNAGLTPVFCDIQATDFNIDPEKIEALITPQTSAIVAVHVFGAPCQVEAIDRIAKKHNLKIIYDAAHAFDVKIDGKGIGTFGDISMFSLHATKVFNSVEGGALTFNNCDYAEAMQAMRNFGMDAKGRHLYPGTNAKMSEFHAAMGLLNLRSVDHYIAIRKGHMHDYIEQFDTLSVPVQIPAWNASLANNGSYFPILLETEHQRDHVFEKLMEAGIVTRKYFYPICNAFESLAYDPQDTPVALAISNRILSLPLYVDLAHEDIVRIVTTIAQEVR
jgi:dTDP-4-amino-4,6-dideoxygalactose transaminase